MVPAVAALPSRMAELFDAIVRLMLTVGGGENVIVMGTSRPCPTEKVEFVPLPSVTVRTAPAAAATVSEYC